MRKGKQKRKYMKKGMSPQAKVRALSFGTVAAASFLAGEIVVLHNLEHCKILFHKNDDVYVECFSELNIEPPEAVVTESDLFNGRKPEVTFVGSNVDTSKIGTYELTYSAKFGKVVATTTKRVHVVDTTAPVIKLETKDGYYVNDYSKYEEEGFIASDAYDGDISNKVSTEICGEYINYFVTDSSGNRATITRTIPYRDEEAPVIHLNGNDILAIQRGSEWIEPGYTVTDNHDEGLDDKVVVTHEVDINTIGEYPVTYSVTDEAGNVGTATRVISVIDKNADNVIYLTFDDGPSPYTMQLLDILDKYNVKATFFVTHTDIENIGDVLRAIVERGHTLGAHTYSHKYKIYKDEPTYYEDLKKILNLIEEETGIRPNLIRFPGGSSNTISKNYCRNIMTQLAESVERHGYTYFDWSVNSRDAEDAKDKNTVYENIITGIQETNRPVVLQHDIKDYSVAATEDVIKWALDNGYIFGALDEDVICHHNILN